MTRSSMLIILKHLNFELFFTQNLAMFFDLRCWFGCVRERNAAHKTMFARAFWMTHPYMVLVTSRNMRKQELNLGYFIMLRWQLLFLGPLETTIYDYKGNDRVMWRSFFLCMCVHVSGDGHTRTPLDKADAT